MALLEADVALPVVRDFIARVKDQALGAEVVGSLSPGQALVGIVTRELAATMGEHSVKGVGGTRNCDWWFTDQAVLIDTAGRYTTQDSHAAADAREWQTFLQLLRRHRPVQPVNGVIEFCVTAAPAGALATGDESVEMAVVAVCA